MFIKEPFKSAWNSKQKSVFSRVRALCDNSPKENIFRSKEGRKTLKFCFTEKSYFLKYHQGIGWKEIIKNLTQLRLPVLGARNEFEAANKLNELGVDTLTPVAYGLRGSNPAKQESFLITEDLINTTSLEDFCKNWRNEPPALKIKRALINKVAQTAKTMHEAGINHRDFYICHFLLENGVEKKIENKQEFVCSLIDLHRCQMRKAVPKRWLVKDLGGLLYSTMDIGLSQRDYFRFVKTYTGLPLKESLRDNVKSFLWRDVLVNAEKLYQKDFKKQPPNIFKIGNT